MSGCPCDMIHCEICGNQVEGTKGLLNKISNLQEQINSLKKALGIAANRLDGASLGIAAHGQNINVMWWVSEYAVYAKEARTALEDKK